MYTQEIEQSRVSFQLFGPSSGTCMFSISDFEPAGRIIVVETPQMFTDFSLVGVQSPVPREQHRLPRPEVIESLERSLVEHGDIWAELANC